jgi:hypothetical protein
MTPDNTEPPKPDTPNGPAGTPPSDGQKEVEELLEMFRQQVARDRPLLPSGCLVPIGCLTGLLAVCSIAVPFLLIFLLFFGLLWLLVRQLAVSKKEREVARKLAERTDVRLAGPLIQVLSWPEDELHVAARYALFRILPRMRASDARLLNAEHRRVLHRVLRSADYAFIEVILKALEQVGDETSIPSVERLANRRAWWPDDRRIRDAARECLPALKARLEGAGHTLLRPTGAADEPAETLLRSVRNTNHRPEDELLRPPQEELPDTGEPKG